MWNRLKSLWSGTFPEIDEDAEAGTEPRARPPATRSHARARAIEAVDEALAQDNAALALARLRQVLVEATPEREELRRAAAVMRAVGEGELAVLFDAAAERSSAEPAARLAAAFLEMDDPPVAAALAKVATQRVQGGDAVVARLLAEATARQGDHGAVVDQLAVWEARWPDAALLGRYALSAVLAGRVDAWQRVHRQVEANPALVWMVDAAARMGTAEDDAPLRRAVFLEYGAVLLDASSVQGRGNVGPGRLARVMQRARDVIKGAALAPERLCYASRRGEVFAQWMARLLDVNAIPLSARIRDQRVLAVAADGDDLDLILGHAAFGHGPTCVFQVLKSPVRTGTAVPELIGLFGQGATLPLGALEAPVAADRVPPRLQLTELLRLAEGAPVGAEAGDRWEGPAGWAERQRPRLLATAVLGGKTRPTWQGDLPSWAFEAPRAEREAEVTPPAGSAAPDGDEEIGLDAIEDVTADV